MIFRAICNRVVFDVEASSIGMARRILQKTYGISANLELLEGFKYSKRHLKEATRHEEGIYGRV